MDWIPAFAGMTRWQRRELHSSKPFDQIPAFAGMTRRQRRELRSRAGASLDAADVLASAGIDLDHLTLADEQRHPHHGAGLQLGGLAATA